MDKEIKDLTGNDLYSRGLSSEGYAGWYRDALNDVLLALNGCSIGNGNSRFWPKG